MRNAFSFWLAISIFINPLGRAPCQLQRTQVAGPRSDGGFHGGATRASVFKFGGLSVTIVPSFPVVLTLDDTNFHKSVELPSEFVEVNTLNLYKTNTLIITGMVNGNVGEVVLVDVGAGKVLDHFPCYTPVVSPDTRWIAFIKFFPPHGISSAESHVMLYDLSLTPEQNRPAHTKRDIATVGRVVFPPNTANLQGDNVDIPEPYHTVLSQSLFWNTGSTTFAFADFYKNVYSAVLISVPPATELAQSKAIPSGLICPQVPGACFETLKQVQFGPSNQPVTMTFDGFNGTGGPPSTILVWSSPQGLEIDKAGPVAPAGKQEQH